MAPLLSIEGVRKEYQVRGKRVLALDSVDLTSLKASSSPSSAHRVRQIDSVEFDRRPAPLELPVALFFAAAPIDGICTQIGYVTQKDNLFPWRTLSRKCRDRAGNQRHRQKRSAAPGGRIDRAGRLARL